MQKTDQKEFRIEKVIKKKGNNQYVKWKGYDNSFNSWIDKTVLYKNSQYYPKPYKSFDGNISVKVDFYVYATKPDIKNISHVDTSSFVLITN